MKRTRLKSFNDAIEGIIHVVKSQTNIRILLMMAVLTLFLSIFLGISKMEFMIITLVIGLVLVSELINSAIECSIDLITDHYHPLARLVKDITAGAVLIASIIAMICGYIIFLPRLTGPLAMGITMAKRAPEYITLMAIIFICIIVVATKARFGKGRPLSGGMPSGHAAISFAIFTAVTLITESPLVFILTFVLATMVSHSRLIYRIHTLWEVVAGGILGSLSTLLLFQIFSY